MDINSISAYTDYIKNQATGASTNKISDMKSSDYANASEDELMDACKQFESYLLEQVFKHMAKTTSLGKGEGSNGALVDYFGDMTIQEISKQSTELQGLGIAEQLYEQMKRNYNLS